MDTLAGAAMPSLPALTGRSFALLDQAERDRLGTLLRPLAWIDGLITATVVAPVSDDLDAEEAVDWIDHVWKEESEAEIAQMTAPQVGDVAMALLDQFCHVAETLFGHPESYRPYLSASGDQMEAAAQWAAGFRYGIRLEPEPWRPLIESDDARAVLVAIFALERDEDLAEASSEESPFHGMPADRRERLRRTALEELADLVLALHDFAASLEDDSHADRAEEPYVRATPKAGRNDPCPCGSGRKYKKCCLGEAEG